MTTLTRALRSFDRHGRYHHRVEDDRIILYAHDGTWQVDRTPAVDCVYAVWRRILARREEREERRIAREIAERIRSATPEQIGSHTWLWHLPYSPRILQRMREQADTIAVRVRAEQRKHRNIDMLLAAFHFARTPEEQAHYKAAQRRHDERAERRMDEADRAEARQRRRERRLAAIAERLDLEFEARCRREGKKMYGISFPSQDTITMQSDDASGLARYIEQRYAPGYTSEPWVQLCKRTRKGWRVIAEWAGGQGGGWTDPLEAAGLVSHPVRW